MKIAYVLNSSDPYGGASKSFLALLKGIIGLGHEALVVLPDAGALKDDIERLGAETVCLNYRPNTYPYDSSFKDYLLWIPRLIARRIVNHKACKQLATMLEGVDLVHTNVSVIDIGARAAKQCDIPHVYHFREYADLDFSMHYFPSESSFLKTVDFSISITKDIQRHHSLSYGSHSVVIYNGIAHKAEAMPSPSDREGKYLLFAGRLEPTKGLDELIHAYGKAQIDTPLWVAGEALKSDYMESLLRDVKEHKLDGKVVFLGMRKDLPLLMRDAKCVIVPSASEAFGRVMPEAMFQGCLVIGKDCGGTHEQFENGLKFTGGEIGLHYKTSDELAELLRHLDSKADERMRQRAFQTVNHFYSIESYVQNTIEFYNHVLSDNKGSRIQTKNKLV